MDAPSIKGMAIQSLVTDVAPLLEDGRVGRDALEARLEAEDLSLLESKISPAGWYPIESYRRLSELLMDVEGHGDSAYIVRRGARAAERLFESGIYPQLRRGEERAEEARTREDDWTELDGNLIVSLAGALFNFTYWGFETESEEPPVYRIEVSGAASFPEVARHAAHGFVQYAASRLVEAKVGVDSERVDPDRIVYTLRLPSSF